MSEWRVGKTCLGLEVVWQVYRLIDPEQCDHSGNREVIGTFDTEAAAQEFAAYKNRRF